MDLDLERQLAAVRHAFVVDHAARHGKPLRPNQLEALRFCIRRDRDLDSLGFRGGIVANDVGMGKTVVQLGVCLAFPARTLVVVPNQVLADLRESASATAGYWLGCAPLSGSYRNPEHQGWDRRARTSALPTASHSRGSGARLSHRSRS